MAGTLGDAFANPVMMDALLRSRDSLVEPFAGHVLLEHLLSSLQRYGLGFLLAVMVGIPLGLAILSAEFAWARYWLRKVKQRSADLLNLVKGRPSCARAILADKQVLQLNALARCRLDCWHR